MFGHFRSSCVRPIHPVVVFILVGAAVLASCTLPRPDRHPAGVPAAAPDATFTPGRIQFLAERARVIGSQPDVVPGEVIIKLAPQMASEALKATPRADGVIAIGLDAVDQLNERFGVKSFDPLLKPVARAAKESIESMARQRTALMGLYIARFDPKTDPQEVAGAYRQAPGVVYAEPNHYVYANDDPPAPLAFAPNDPYFPEQWNLAVIQVPQAWDRSAGQGVLVAVLDTGIAYEDYDQYREAPDLKNTKFVPGYDFVNDDAHPNDDSGHGTHVAGTIAQSTNNGYGAAGVAFGATLMPVKVLDDRGQGSFDALAQGLMYAADQGARVVNLSLSGRSDSQLLADAIAYAVNKGVLVVAAAGNGGGTVEYPAAYDGVVAVGAIDSTQNRAPYSAHGPQVSVVAPGGDTGTDRNGDGYPDGILQQTFQRGNLTDFGFYFLEGTSMAAPHVTGVAALLFGLNPSASAAQVRRAIESSARDLGPAGRDDAYGYGLVQAAAALDALGGASPAPSTTLTPQLPAPTEAPLTCTAQPATPTPVPSAVISQTLTPEPSAVVSPTVSVVPPAATVLRPTVIAVPATATLPPPTAGTQRPTFTPEPPDSTPGTPTPEASPAAPDDATPTGLPTLTLAATVAAGPLDLIVNGGFETTGGWVFGSTALPADYSTELVHSGSRSMRLGNVGGPDVASYSSVMQSVTLPADARAATLSFWWYPISQDTYPNDAQIVLVLDQNLRVLGTVEHTLSDARQWSYRSYDMSAYMGQTVLIYFGVYNSGMGNELSAMYVDDVSLTVYR